MKYPARFTLNALGFLVDKTFRFATKEKNLITCLNLHAVHSFVDESCRYSSYCTCAFLNIYT